MASTALNRLLVCTVLALLFASPNAFAVSITSVDSVAGGGTATVNPIITTTANNDNASVFGGNLVVAGKVIDSGVPVDIASLVHDADLVGFFNGIIPNGLTDAITLSIDLPDLFTDQFTLRQTALVPEPSTLSLTVVGLALTILAARRRRD